MVTRVYHPVWAWSWSAVMAGVFVSLLVQILLTMVGLGIGMLAVDIPTADSAPATVGWATFVWWAMSGILAAFAGGLVAASLSEDESEHFRVGHAVAAWVVTTVIVVGVTAFSAGSAANVMANLGGPAYAAAQQVDALRAAPRTTTTGQTVQPAPRLTRAEADKARKHFGYVMLASFAALLLGAGAAYAGGLSAPQESLRIAAVTTETVTTTTRPVARA
jgi:hypothetical protein